ncbi:MAG: hypothetical protein K9L61_04435 [Candidatus Omnitrophica bacterium]|nr:hypothetical protein [Candidatus Omnitrophota bacterium]
MIGKIRKAQALTEMAIFGTIILLCLHYLLTYIQKMDRQQYINQEAFRSALEKASAPDLASVGYTIFSNRQQVSLNSPLVGEKSQISGSGQVYWGATEYTLTVDGPEVVEDLESRQYYKFNKDEKDLTDQLEGTVTAGELAEVTGDPSGLLSDLVNNGYIDADGNFQDSFTNLEDSSDLVLSSAYESQRDDIYNLLEDEYDVDVDITISSDSDKDVSKQITYGGGNISSSSRAGIKNKVKYEFKDEDGNLLYPAIEQAVDEKGEYSQAAFLADRKVYNVMRDDNSDRIWTVSKEGETVQVEQDSEILPIEDIEIEELGE